MPVDISSVRAGLLPADGSSWQPVTTGESGAIVLHDRDRERYAKLVPTADADDLAAERDRIAWLHATGVPTASVLDWRATDDGACVITSAVAGVPADQLDAAALRRAWPGIAAIARELHDLPAADGATTRPTPSGTPPSPRSSSAAPPPPATSKTSPPSSANATSTPTPSPSATTAPEAYSAPPAASPSSRPTPSVRFPSARASCSSAPPARSSPTCIAGPNGATNDAPATRPGTPSYLAPHLRDALRAARFKQFA